MAGGIIAVDIGTQGTKAMLFDTDMRILASAFEPSRLIRPAPGTVWQEPDDIYHACTKTIRRVMDSSGIDRGDILAVGIDSQMAGIMGVDENGDAVTVYDSWLDTRCAPYVQQMRERAGSRVTAITGGPITYTHGPKILWWKHERPEAYTKIHSFVLPHGYVAGKLAGLRGDELYFDYTCIQYSGFGDNRRLVWSDELLELFSVDRAKFPRIVSPFEVIGGFTAHAAEQCGLAAGTRLVAGGGDTACSIFGSGVFEKNRLFDCAGTASVMCGVTDSFVPDTKYETLTMMRSPIEGIWYPLAYINGGGLCLPWFRDEVAGPPAPSYQELEALAAPVPPGSDGLIFVPHFAGRVLPSSPALKGAYIGLDGKQGRGHLFRALMEGIAYEYHYYLKVLKELYPENPFDTMYVVGGGAKSPIFNQIKADVLGVLVVPFSMGDAALAGSAVIAGLGTGVFKNWEEPLSKGICQREALLPNSKNHAAYKKYAKAYRDFLDAMTPVYEKHQQICAIGEP